MKEGMQLQEIAEVLDYQRSRKKDFVAPNARMKFDAAGNKLLLEGVGEFSVGDLAHEQIAGRLDIPGKYYERMRQEQQSLLEQSVNTWLHAEPEDTRLVRTLDGTVRAFLSDKFRPLDNVDMMEAVLPAMMNSDCKIESCNVSDKKLYIKAVSNNVKFLAPESALGKKHDGIERGETLQAGIVVSNSEVGCGGLNIEPLIWKSGCRNGAIITQAAFKKFHIGRTQTGGEAAYEFFRDETRLADDRALWLKVRDVVSGIFEQVNFSAIAQKFHEATADVIQGDPIKCIEAVAEVYSLNVGERNGVLTHLLRDGDMNRYGVLNAVTRASQDLGDYERATELERLGGRILELPKKEWMKFATAE